MSAVHRLTSTCLRAAVPALAAIALLSACSSEGSAGGTTPQPAGSAEATSSLDPAGAGDELSDLADQLETAYNSLPLGSQLTYEEYQELYAPIWDRAGELGYTLTRVPVQSADGFTLTESEATLPGHALLTEVTGDGVTACIAASDAVDASALSADQAEQARSAERIFLLLEGGCDVHAAYLATL